LWSLVRAASQEDAERAAAAMRQLCAMYREPIVARLRRHGRINDAEDLANGFVEYLLERNRLKSFVREKARFRSYLLACLEGFVRDEWRRQVAQKRGGGQAPASLDDVQVGQQEALDQYLDRQFARAVHHRVVAQLAAEHAAKGQSDRFTGLKPYLLGADGALSYAELGRRLGLSESNVTVAILRMRRRYSDLFRGEVAQTVASDEVDAEMRYLITLLADTEATAGS
jgi:RNA polymerase sigma-70 factor (ECF subfamily)